MNTLESQRATIEKLTADLATANQTATTAAYQIAALTTERDLAIAERDQTAAYLGEATTKITALTTDLAARDLEITNLKAAAVTVETRAQQLLASNGHEPLAITPDTNLAGGSESTTDLWAQYKAIKDPQARAAFYRANSKKLNSKS